MNNKLVCLVGMCGSGKSEVANFFVKEGYQYIRFGQITIDEVRQRGLAVNEANERAVREELRKKHGMAAYAILNLSKFDEALKKGQVIGDGLYSWDEYKVLKEKYGDKLIIIAIYSSPKTRYFRLADREKKHGEDPKKIFRSYSPKEAKKRDFSEIENLDKGGPIAMADYTLVNEDSLEQLQNEVKMLINKISHVN